VFRGDDLAAHGVSETLDRGVVDCYLAHACFLSTRTAGQPSSPNRAI
jgi:hypothetical protein